MPSTIPFAQYIFKRLAQLNCKSVHGVPGDFFLRALDHLPSSGSRWIGNANEYAHRINSSPRNVRQRLTLYLHQTLRRLRSRRLRPSMHPTNPPPPKQRPQHRLPHTARWRLSNHLRCRRALSHQRPSRQLRGKYPRTPHGSHTLPLSHELQNRNREREKARPSHAG